MRKFVLFAVLPLFAADPLPLFNGKDLTGWRMTGFGGFVVEEGALKTQGGMGLLWYPARKFGNETIRVVFRTTSGSGNAGVFIRLPEAPPDAFYGVHNGYEVQILSKGDDWHSTGAIYSLSKVTKRAQKDGWNTMDIQLDGPITRVTLNGELVNEFKQGQEVPERKQWYEPVRGPRPDYGYIGLQNHDADSVVYFKEVSVITPGSPLDKGDKERMLSYLHATRKQVLDSIAGLSSEQLHYKSAPERWSIAEVVEHLIHTEPALFGVFRAMLRTPPVAGAKPPLTDEAIVGQMTDRSKRAEAPPMLRPQGKLASADALTEEFKKRRQETVLFVRDTTADLRGRVAKMGPNEVSAYQMLLRLPAHNERHLAQINEVKASEGYPKK